jgi:hypothetical protein
VQGQPMRDREQVLRLVWRALPRGQPGPLRRHPVPGGASSGGVSHSIDRRPASMNPHQETSVRFSRSVSDIYKTHIHIHIIRGRHPNRRTARAVAPTPGARRRVVGGRLALDRPSARIDA